MSSPPAKPTREAGYNLVILMVAVTVLNILVAAAIPLWRTAIRREKEEELISRGLQYAEGIRNFQRRFGRLPVRLDELVKTKPRCMRQLWADPITGANDWVPIRLMVSDNVDRDEEGGRQPEAEEDPDGRPDETAEREPEGAPAGGFGTIDPNVGLGGIRGVRSRSREEAIKTFLNQNRYDKWHFTVEVLMAPSGSQVGVGVNTGGLIGTQLPMRWVGRPFRPGINPLLPGAPPAGGDFSDQRPPPPPPPQPPPRPPADGN